MERDPLHIKVYGTTTSGYNMVVDVIKDVLAKANIPYRLEVINDVKAFLDKGIESVPAIQVGDDKIYALKSNGAFNRSLRHVVHQLLASADFGDLPMYVIPIDFSPVSLNALMYGQRLATDAGVVTKALHVYRPKPVIEAAHGLAINDLDDAKYRLHDIVYKLDMDWGSDILKSAIVDEQFEVGFPEEKILEVAKVNAASLIIMGSVGGGPVKKLLGSVSSGVVENAECPVLIVPQAAHYRGIKRIAFAYDGTPICENSLVQISTFARQFSAQIDLVHVAANHKSQHGGAGQLLSRLSSYYNSDSISTHLIEAEDVVHGLQDYCHQHDVDVLTLNPGHRSLLSRLFEKSVSRELLAITDIPILAVKC